MAAAPRRRLRHVASCLSTSAGDAAATASAAAAATPALIFDQQPSATFTHRGMPLGCEMGQLRDSSHLRTDGPALRSRMESDGYVLLRGLLDRPTVKAARLEVLQRLAMSESQFVLDTPEHPVHKGIFREGATNMSFMPTVTVGNDPLQSVLRTGPLLDVLGVMLNGKIRAFDYTWFRVKSPGTETSSPPHTDSIYMGRGTPDLYTCWTPFSDVDLSMGGLMILEGSHRKFRHGAGGTHGLREYAAGDVDSHCAADGETVAAIAQARREGRALTVAEQARLHENKRSALLHGEGVAQALSDAHSVVDPAHSHVMGNSGGGGRWLTSHYRMGDALIFSIFTMHASTDNRAASGEVRLSSDTRYQLASEPCDDRWVGEEARQNISPHGLKSQVSRDCGV